MRQKLGTFTSVVTAGAVAQANPSISLPFTHFVTSLFLRVSLGVTNTGAVVYFEDALARSFRFRLFLEGDDPVLNLRGDNLKCVMVQRFGTAGTYNEVPGGAGAQTGTWNFELPIADRRLRSDPRTTKVDLALCDNPRMEIDFPATIASASAGTAVITSCSVALEAELDLRPAGLPGPDVLARYLPLRRTREITNSTLLASTADQIARLPFGRLVREYHIITRDRAASPVRSDALVTALEIAPNFVRAGKMQFTDLLSETKTSVTNQGGTPLTGAVMLDFDQNRQLNGSGMLNLIGTRDQVLFVDTAALANNLDLVVVEESVDFPSRGAVEKFYAIAGRR